MKLLNTDLTDSLSLETDYLNSEFIADGIGEVELIHCTDGDTATFISGGQTFALRFLGIDTPESTYRFDPWGKAAATFTCEKLTAADSIVLEADGDIMDGNGRYLSWVWYDGRLLNLELIEQAYSSSKSATGLKYSSKLYEAELYAQETKLRVWGETDPTYDYSLEGVQLTIEELVTNSDLYISRKVVIEGVITSVIEGNPYIQQGDFGIYLYKGFVDTSKFVVGNYVRIESLSVTIYETTGQLQVIGLLRNNIDLISTDNVIIPQTYTIDTITDNNIGAYLKLENLTVDEIYFSKNDSNVLNGDFTVYFSDENENEIALRSENLIDIEAAEALFTVGTVMNIEGPVAIYNGNYQILLQALDNVEIID